MILEMAFDLDLTDCNWTLLREGKFLELLPCKNNISAELIQIINVMMSPHPAHRPTANELLQHGLIKQLVRNNDTFSAPLLHTPKTNRSQFPLEPMTAPTHHTNMYLISATTRKQLQKKRYSWDNLPIDNDDEENFEPKKNLLMDFDKAEAL
eukprot:TRINITY_DN7601_c0_g1_i2.p1 TRINITY_DN7601_c0_g1~~TRINITY_DN7601_c0_g1_i2.p1  ORF type:complete len:152 (-),score=9.39 TRINITY_DN7601_c0_g1_i2:102-557(-)